VILNNIQTIETEVILACLRLALNNGNVNIILTRKSHFPTDLLVLNGSWPNLTHKYFGFPKAF